jgi:hypothetical protein
MRLEISAALSDANHEVAVLSDLHAELFHSHSDRCFSVRSKRWIGHGFSCLGPLPAPCHAAVPSELEEQLRHLDRLAVIGELTAHLAHEVRNPLGAILGAVFFSPFNFNDLYTCLYHREFLPTHPVVPVKHDQLNPVDRRELPASNQAGHLHAATTLVPFYTKNFAFVFWISLLLAGSVNFLINKGNKMNLKKH